ncbi:MAG: DUF460 domain-containing protein [Candidatus Woesearchaeota archaeon]
MRLIAGIDPGTTIGWAAFDLHGRLVDSGARKGLDRDLLVAKLAQLGKVIAVGTDKARTPSLVAETATKLGARVINPLQDIRVDEKREMTSHIEFHNSHEMDAVASAIVAMRKLQPLLNKIHSFLQNEKRLGMFEEVSELVIKDEIGIRAALAILTPKEEKEKLPPEKQKRDEELSRLYGLFSRSRKDAAILSSRNKELESEIFKLKQQVEILKNKTAGLVRPRAHSEIARIKDAQIRSLEQRLKNSLHAQSRLALLVEKLEKLMLQNDKVPVIRLPRLGWDDVLKSMEFIGDGSILFVDDANQISERAVAMLYEKGVRIIICGKPPGHRARAQLPFACIPAEDCELLGNIVMVKKDWLDNIRSERSVLAKVVEEYKKERLSS